MTTYFVDKNYHENFSRYLVYDWKKMKDKDSLFLEFMVKKDIKNVYSIGGTSVPNGVFKDSVLAYQFMYIPIFGKRRELVFDFSSEIEDQGRQQGKIKFEVIDNGVYYVEY